MAGLSNLNDLLKVTASGVRGVTSSGILRPANPAVAVRMTKQLRTWGTGPALGFALGASRSPEELAVVDVDDPLHPEVTFAEIDHRCNALASGLVDRGVTANSRLALLARNSRAYTEVMVAASRIGADVIYVDTAATAQAVRSVTAAESIDMMVRNSAFAARCPEGLAWLGTDDPAGVSLLDALPIRGAITPTGHSQHLLAVGDGHRESADVGLRFDTFARILDALPVRLGGTHLIAAPMFAPWGWLHHRLATTLGATQVLLRQHDPERILALVQAHNVEILATTPSVVDAMMNLPAPVRAKYDTSSLNCIAVGGMLPPSVVDQALNHFGDVLYTSWGTASQAVVTVAAPSDLRANPATAGAALAGVRISVRDDDGQAVPTGQLGHIFVVSRAPADNSAGAPDGWEATGAMGALTDDGLLTLVSDG